MIPLSCHAKNWLNALRLPQRGSDLIFAGKAGGESIDLLKVGIAFSIGFKRLKQIPHRWVIRLVADQHDRM